MIRFASLLLLLNLAFFCKSQGQEEFNGPFASWANVKKRFGATGNGKSDDTRALQKALDQLSDRSLKYNSGPGAYTVIYLPAGVYCISSTLQLKGKVGVTIIGEDPAKTIIKWIGRDNDTIFWSNGSAYFRLSRISWDPNGRKDMEGVGIHWKDKWRNAESRSYAALNIEVSDCYFLSGFAVGLGGGSAQAGWTGNNDSEIAIRRCRFYNCTVAGINIHGYNALDYWIWDCRFYNCELGVKSRLGNYHAYRCYFSQSKYSDFHQANAYYTSVRWCYSENSNAFSLDDGNSCNPFKRIYQGNIVVNPKQMAVEFYHLGRMTLFDNEFDYRKTAKHPYTINQNSWCQGIYAFLGIKNSFVSKQPVRVAPANRVMYQYLQDSLVKFSKSAAQFLANQQTMPQKIKRTVFEVPQGASAKTIQDIVTKASKLRKRAIVHFPPGDFTVDQTLIIPANSDIQIIGDGYLYATVLVPHRNVLNQKAPLILVKGPSAVLFKDIQLGQGGNSYSAPSLVFENVDQVNASAIIDQLYSLSDTSLYMKGNDNLKVQKENSFFSAGNFIESGPMTRQGRGNSKVTAFGGQFARLHTENNSTFIARDVWWEGSDRIPLDLHGSGNITIDGAMIAPAKPDSLATIRINRFKGKISLMNLYVQGAIDVTRQNPDLELFAWNINFYYRMNPAYFLNAGVPYKALLSGFTAQCMNPKTPACSETPASFGEYTSNITDKQAYILAMTKDIRADQPLKYTARAAGTSNIYISRVSILQQGRAISFISHQ